MTLDKSPHFSTFIKYDYSIVHILLDGSENQDEKYHVKGGFENIEY